jgi:hypothetical protein
MGHQILQVLAHRLLIAKGMMLFQQAVNSGSSPVRRTS